MRAWACATPQTRGTIRHMTTQEKTPLQPLQHHFVVYGERNDDGTIKFETDAETLIACLSSSGVYDPNTGEWLGASELLNDEDLYAEELAISEALYKLFETPVGTDAEEVPS